MLVAIIIIIITIIIITIIITITISGKFICVFECTIVNLTTYRQITNTT